MRVYTGNNLELKQLVQKKFEELGYKLTGGASIESAIGFFTTEYNGDKNLFRYAKDSVVDLHKKDYGPEISIIELFEMKPPKTLKDVKIGEEFKITASTSTFKKLNNLKQTGKYKYMYYSIDNYTLFGANDEHGINVV